MDDAEKLIRETMQVWMDTRGDVIQRECIAKLVGQGLGDLHTIAVALYEISLKMDRR